MSVQMKRVTVTATTYTLATPNITTSLYSPASILVANESSSSTDIVLVSFDGVNDDGRLIPGVLPAIVYAKRGTRVWLRLESAGSVSVQVIFEE